MKTKHYTILTLLLTAGMVYATQGTDRKQPRSEKVKPAENFSAKAASTMNTDYPLLTAEGSEDGIPYGLRTAGVNNKEVKLTWLSPEKLDGYFDDFENHTDFAVNSPGSIGWTYVDADNKNTYTWQACSFPNMGGKMAFIVMNAAETTPAVIENPNYTPFSGEKMLVDFCAIDAPNNDFLISPQLNFDRDFHISFRARSYTVTANIPAERIKVGYSVSTMRPSDFTFVNEGDYLELPAEWTLVDYTIPKEAKYVCVNCVSNDAFMLMIDDIFIGTNNVRPAIAPMFASSLNPLKGFNIYRNGVKVNDCLVNEIRYTDTVEDYDTYQYAVTAVYADGTESEPSEAVTVEVPDIRLLPFEDDFDDWTLHADKWTVVSNDAYEPHWKIDYYVYGLTDPAASFGWTSMNNYDQSLVSRELHTLDRASTCLRFNLRLQNEKVVNVDYLLVEVSCDNGTSWKQVAQFSNTEGEYDWRTHEFSLGELLDSDFFQIRFRAKGTNAYYIDYWYVDDVKVWNPEWASASVTANDADGAVEGCLLTLTGDHGGIYSATTDSQGIAQLPKIEKGNYTVKAEKAGHNAYETTWTVGDSDNELRLHMTRPVAVFSETDIRATLTAESKTSGSFSLANKGDGPMTWSLISTPESFSGDNAVQLKRAKSWTTSGDLQTSIAFDGTHYYTTSSVMLGKFWKYDRQGKLLDHFSIPGMYYKLYDLTYDGRYFYGSDYKNRIFQLDFENRKVVKTITVAEAPELTITHCSWDPDRKGFWVGGLGTIALIDTEGKLKTLVTAISNTESVAIFGSAYDNVTPGGPYLWMADESEIDDYSLDCVMLRQYNLSTRKFTDVKHVVNDVPGYVVGNPNMGRNYICGLCATTALEDGCLTLIGVLQQSPCLIFQYSLDEVDSWLGYSPKQGVLLPGQQQLFNVGYDALKMKQGESLSTKATLLTVPELAEQTVTFSITANAESPTPRPQELKAEADSAAVNLSWQQGYGTAQPQGYYIYRNGARVNSRPVTATSYQDRQMVYGSYSYQVSAIYSGDKESALSDSTVISVTKGAPYYCPLNLTTSVERNKRILLEWLSPTHFAQLNDTMTWATGVHADQMGLAAGGYFYAATKWEPEDLVRYRNKTIHSVGVQLVNPCTYLALFIYKNGTVIYKKPYWDDILYNGTFTDIELTQELTIDPSATYLFAFMIMNDANIQPLAIDGSETRDGKGNLISEDGKTWYTALNSGISGNFNIRVNLTPNEQDGEEQPEGYNIYRNGTLLNNEPVPALAFADSTPAAGCHTYTVASVYADGGVSGFSEPAEARIIDIGPRYAPAAINTHTLINRQVSLRWDYPMAAPCSFPLDLTSRPVTAKEGCPEMLRTFLGTATEMAVGSDGKHIYTSIYSENGRINKYSLDGQYLEHFTLEGVNGVRNIAYDGNSFYLTDNQNDIKRVDMDSRTILETIDISEYGRHLAYIPDLNNGNGGFEVGDWETSILVSKDGSKLATGPALLGAAGTAYYNGMLYAFEQGGPENSYSIGIYDLTTNERTGSINLDDYAEFDNLENCTAGGMSLVTTQDGIHILALALQRATGNTRFVFLELEGVKGVSGYNIYRNGTKLNARPIPYRYYEEELTFPGLYDYTIETVYIDEEVSAKSHKATVSIQTPDTAKRPESVKAVQDSYGYNVIVSMASPYRYDNTAASEDCESLTPGEPLRHSGWTNNDDGWKASADYALDGELSITPATDAEAWLTLPATGIRYLKMALRNANDQQGAGAVEVLYSTEDSNKSNFISLETFTATEMWSEQLCELPEGTRYAALRKAAGVKPLYVDAIRLYSTVPEETVFAYDIFRNGEQINSQPVTQPAFMDRNLLPGHYEYQARLTTVLSATSELSEPSSIDLAYSSLNMPPTCLSAKLLEDNTVSLSWEKPSIGEPVFLKWHDGNCQDAAGLPNGGAFFAGVRWNASDLKAYEKLSLTHVEVFVNQIPDALYLLVYEGTSLVRQQFVSRLQERSFNNITLQEPLPLNTSKELRVVVYVEHNAATVPLGYDKGPGKNGYGDLYSTDGNTWTTLAADETSIDGNWNISIGLSPYTADGASLVDGYNIYRNGERLNDDYVAATSYIDNRPYTGRYLVYQVSAVYGEDSESLSDKVTLTASGIDERTADNTALDVVLTDGQLRIRGAHCGDDVSLVSASGTVILHSTVPDSYISIFSTPYLTAGTYLLTIGEKTMKVMVR